MNLNRETFSQKKAAQSLRKQETRTKIQLGGLVIKSGLTEELGIIPGEDLQMNLEKREATEILLGLLVEATERLHQTPALQKSWQTLGQTWFSKDLFWDKKETA